MSVVPVESKGDKGDKGKEIELKEYTKERKREKPLITVSIEKTGEKKVTDKGDKEKFEDDYKRYLSSYTFHIFNFVQFFLTAILVLIYVLILVKFLAIDHMYKKCDTVSCIAANETYYQYILLLIVCFTTAVLIIIRCLVSFYMYSIKGHLNDCVFGKDCCTKLCRGEGSSLRRFGWIQMVCGTLISTGLLFIGLSPAQKDGTVASDTYLLIIHFTGVFILIVPGIFNMCSARVKLDEELGMDHKHARSHCCVGSIGVCMWWVKVCLQLVVFGTFIVLKIWNSYDERNDITGPWDWGRRIMTICFEFLTVLLIQIDYLVAVYFSYVHYRGLDKNEKDVDAKINDWSNQLNDK